MNRLLRIIIAIPAIIFVMTGIGYILDPANTAAQFGMPLLEGLGRSTQIGTLAAFFFTAGFCVLLATTTGNRFWYYPAAMLTGLTAIFRVIAWLLHDATLATDQILPEVVFTFLFLYAANRLTEKD
ncbi:MAG: hypothetical protein ACKVKD_10385 [Pseudomonadales bacterium]|jgi:uncharacterized membrane protein YoaK (UPF0700 family)|tara:strand:- start:429 stop:806 length:378 start_codon:yes stop_codon:yes gene_type:complete